MEALTPISNPHKFYAAITAIGDDVKYDKLELITWDSKHLGIDIQNVNQNHDYLTGGLCKYTFVDRLPARNGYVAMLYIKYNKSGGINRIIVIKTINPDVFFNFRLDDDHQTLSNFGL
jgi:hypothetical protein